MAAMAAAFTLLLSLVAVSATKVYSPSSVSYDCPTVDPEPCSCNKAHGNLYLLCSGLSNKHQLRTAFQTMAGHGITELQIKDSNVTHIPRDLFKSSPVTRIRIQNTMMIYLFDRDLEYGSDSLTDIVLEKVDFEGGLDWNLLENLEGLRIFSVAGSELETVPFSSSELELELEALILERNRLEVIHEFSFQYFRNLKNIKLNKNLLRRYDRSILPLPESGLQFLDLSDNLLTSLPEDAFDGMAELHSLLLRGNKISVLENSYMKGVFPSLYYLDAADNPLRCDCQMTWLLSNKKPHHMFGECTSLAAKRRPLRELSKEDFIQCV